MKTKAMLLDTSVLMLMSFNLRITVIGLISSGKVMNGVNLSEKNKRLEIGSPETLMETLAISGGMKQHSYSNFELTIFCARINVDRAN